MPQPKDADPNRNLSEREGIWYVRYKIGGVSKRQSLDTTDVKKARAERDKILKEVGNLRQGKAPPVIRTWQEAVDGCQAFLEAKARAGGISASAVARYVVSWDQITAALGFELDSQGRPKPIPLDDISKPTVVDFIVARREEDRANSTILNDLTAWSHVMAHADDRGWVDGNVIATVDRLRLVGVRRSEVTPPTDPQVVELIAEVSEWSFSMGRLIRWLRETGMRLAEALNLRAEDIHPGGLKATLKRGVKRNRGEGGPATRTITLGPVASGMLAEMPTRGRLFADLHLDSAVVSTRYGQWKRQRQAREKMAAAAEGRETVTFEVYRLHDLRHAFACASLVDDPECIYRLSLHMGHTMVATTEIYVAHLRKDGAMWKYGRDPALFGSLPPDTDNVRVKAA